MDLQRAYSASRPAEVTFGAAVATLPHFFVGRRTHCLHESFEAKTVAGEVEVVDNLCLAPRVPVRPGDRIEVRGEMVHDPGRLPIVHWTHHDPSGRHAGGFIRLRGRTYA